MLKYLLVVVLLFPVTIFGDTFVAGKDYEIVNSVDQAASEEQATVMEFFSYGCPWCYRLEPSINQWVKQQDKKIQFSRVPVVFNKEWIYYAKAYYTADLLGLGTKFNPLLFKAIQTDKQPLNNNQAMIDFFMAQGVDKETAESAFTHSTTIDMKVNEGNGLMGSFHINGVPAFVVNNRYKTDLQMAQGEERLFKILDYLVIKANTTAPA